MYYFPYFNTPHKVKSLCEPNTTPAKLKLTTDNNKFHVGYKPPPPPQQQQIDIN